MTQPFLSAEWRKLVMANYQVDASLLRKFLPAKTEIDLWNYTCYVSLVGFMFLNTRLKGFKIPFHTNFEEVNLRFYVRHHDGKTWKRGVVFIKEIVPKPALTFVANTLYGEHYQTLPMKHRWAENEESLTVSYEWKLAKWNSIRIKADKELKEIKDSSEEEFITEHYWGYTKISEGATMEYAVEHPKWLVYPMKDFFVDVDFGRVYGNEFAGLDQPNSVFLAEGSEVFVGRGVYI